MASHKSLENLSRYGDPRMRGGGKPREHTLGLRPSRGDRASVLRALGFAFFCPPAQRRASAVWMKNSIDVTVFTK